MPGSSRLTGMRLTEPRCAEAWGDSGGAAAWVDFTWGSAWWGGRGVGTMLDEAPSARSDIGRMSGAIDLPPVSRWARAVPIAAFLHAPRPTRPALACSTLA